MRAIVLLLLLAPLAGCVGQDVDPDQRLPDQDAQHPVATAPGDQPTTQEAPPSAPAAGERNLTDPFDLFIEETDCYALIVAFFPPAADIAPYLPSGFTPQPAASALETAFFGSDSLRPTADLMGRTLVALEAHACGGAEGHQDGYLITVVDVDPALDVPAPADMVFFDLAWAGHEPTGVREDLGIPFFGDHVHMRLDESMVGLAGSVEVRSGGTITAAFAVEAPEQGAAVEPGVVRQWRTSEDGILHADLAHFTDGQPRALLYEAGPDLDCTIATGTIVADILGVTSCMEAMEAGLGPAGVILARHDMDVSVAYRPA